MIYKNNNILILCNGYYLINGENYNAFIVYNPNV